MKRLLFFLILSLSAHGQILSGILAGGSAAAPASIAQVGSGVTFSDPTATQHGSVQTTSGVNTSAGNRWICAVQYFDNGADGNVTSMTSSGGTTLTLNGSVLARADVAGVRAEIWDGNITAGATGDKVTATWGAVTMEFVSLACEVWSGLTARDVLSSSIHATSATCSNAANGVASGTFSTTSANELVWVWLGGGSMTWTAGSSPLTMTLGVNTSSSDTTEHAVVSGILTTSTVTGTASAVDACLLIGATYK